jgi:chaperonin cofactor prefoldin
MTIAGSGLSRKDLDEIEKRLEHQLQPIKKQLKNIEDQLHRLEQLLQGKRPISSLF